MVQRRRTAIVVPRLGLCCSLERVAAGRSFFRKLEKLLASRCSPGSAHFLSWFETIITPSVDATIPRMTTMPGRQYQKARCWACSGGYHLVVGVCRPSVFDQSPNACRCTSRVFLFDPSVAQSSLWRPRNHGRLSPPPSPARPIRFLLPCY